MKFSELSWQEKVITIISVALLSLFLSIAAPFIGLFLIIMMIFFPKKVSYDKKTNETSVGSKRGDNVDEIV